MKLRCLVSSGLILVLAVSGKIQLYAQVVQPGTQTNGSGSNNIFTAVPFLLITPDARSGGMGDVGVAVQPDINSMSINPAKLVYLKKPAGLAISYSPWLKKLVPDINLAYLSGYYHLDNRNTVGGSLRFFSLGQLQLTDINQQDLGIYSPNEFAVDAIFARKFGDGFSMGSAVRYIYSNLSSGQFSMGQLTHPGTALSLDISAYYQEPTIMFGTDAMFSAGAYISNIGTKLGYVEGGNKQFLPTNMKIGAAASLMPNNYDLFTFALDFNKLLVPTQPEYDLNGNIVRGRDPNRSVPAGVFGSFTDAPGGFSEELSEISISAGVEYWYNQQFALRTGYFYESPKKGNRRYLTAGVGLKYNVFNIDLSYLIANQERSPLASTLRFSILFNFGGIKDNQQQ